MRARSWVRSSAVPQQCASIASSIASAAMRRASCGLPRATGVQTRASSISGLIVRLSRPIEASASVTDRTARSARPAWAAAKAVIAWMAEAIGSERADEHARGWLPPAGACREGSPRYRRDTREATRSACSPASPDRPDRLGPTRQHPAHPGPPRPIRGELQQLRRDHDELLVPQSAMFGQYPRCHFDRSVVCTAQRVCDESRHRRHDDGRAAGRCDERSASARASSTWPWNASKCAR